jgi:hypothetical protein
LFFVLAYKTCTPFPHHHFHYIVTEIIVNMPPKKAEKKGPKEVKRNPFEFRKKPRHFPALNQKVKDQEAHGGLARSRAFEKVCFLKRYVATVVSPDL